MRGAEPVALRDITDGTSNTIIALDAGDDHAVEWTKPADWEFDPDPAVESIFKSHEPGRHQHGVRGRLGALHQRDDQGRDASGAC